MLWGFGTALGELPPYFIARHAAEVSDKLKELEEAHLLKMESREQIEEEERMELTLKMEVEEVEEEN